MSSATLLAGVLWSSTSAAPVAEEARWSVSVSEEGSVRFWGDEPETVPDESLQDGMNRLYLLVARGGLELGSQIDLAFAFPEERASLVIDQTPPTGARNMLWTTEDTWAVVLEKKFLRFRHESMSAELGDLYRSVGRGMALSMLRSTELDVDTSIEGASLAFDGEHVTVAGWGGLSNPQTITAGFRNILRPDVRDRLAGAEATVDAGPYSLSLHATALEVDEKFPGVLIYDGSLYDVRRWVAGGASIRIPWLAGADLYLEADLASVEGAHETVDGRRNRTYPGEAVYGGLTSGLGAWTIQLEGKRYRRFELLNVRQGESEVAFDYATPPSLEKEEVLTPNASRALNSNDIAGGRIFASRRLGPGRLKAGWLHETDWGHPAVGVQDFSGNEDIDQLTLGFEHRGVERFFQATAGVRYETRHEDATTHDTQVHIDADAIVPLGPIGLEVKLAAWRQTEHSLYTGEKIVYDVSQGVVSVRPFRRIAVAGLLDTTTDESVIGGPGQGGNVGGHAFGAVEVTVEPTDNSTARLFAGATQGGLKCSGGTCRVVPAFEGVRVEWLARF